MGGFTSIKLKDCSRGNIVRQNTILDIYKVPKKYRFSCLENEQAIEYEYFKRGMGSFPERQFPKNKINSLEDFKKFWTPEALGEVFVPPSGTLQFDCYFGRTSKKAMRKMGRYIAENIREFKEFEGSFSTFMERGMTAIERKIVDESGISY
jgi:hypothetical protein